MDFSIVLAGSTLASLLDLIDDTLQFRYAYGAVTPLTWPHTTGWRTLPYLVTAQGEGKGSLEVAGKRPLIGLGGTSICVPAGVFHCCTMHSKRGLSRWSCTTYTVLGGIDLFTLLDAPLVITGKAARRIGDINSELSEIGNSAEITLAQRVRRKELGLSMLSAILEKASLRAEHSELVQDSRRLSPVCQYVRENLNRPIGVDDLAQRAHLSVARFHVVFRRYSGVSPNRYVQNVRVQRAQELLLSTDLSVSEVSEQVGVEDPFFFSRMFKKRTGISPSHYRAQISKRLV